MQMEPVFFAKEFENKNFSNHIVFICDHASNYIPRKYRKLGISNSDLGSHIAFDIGAKNLNEISKDISIHVESLKLKCKSIYSKIIHNYSDFNVMTIDRFTNKYY